MPWLCCPSNLWKAQPRHDRTSDMDIRGRRFFLFSFRIFRSCTDTAYFLIVREWGSESGEEPRMKTAVLLWQKKGCSIQRRQRGKYIALSFHINIVPSSSKRCLVTAPRMNLEHALLPYCIEGNRTFVLCLSNRKVIGTPLKAYEEMD